MKKTLISIVGICLILLAFSACQPRYVFIPFPDGGSSSPSGTPVSNAEELTTALQNGDSVYLTQNINLNAADLIDLTGNIDGNGNTITIPDTTSASGVAAALQLEGASIRNAIIDVSNAAATSVISRTNIARYNEDVFSILIQGNGTTLENVRIITGGKAGINIHSASNVTLRNVTIDDCAKAPVNISSSSNVVIDGITANGSSWYGRDNVIQVNGVGGTPNHTASSIRFISTGNIDKVWVEAVENTYNETAGITDSDFEATSQTSISGLDNWDIRFSNQPSKNTKGWTYYAPNEDATTFVLNDEATDSEADLIAMITAVDGSSNERKYDVIQLTKDITVTDQIAVSCKIILDLNGKTLSNTDSIWNEAARKWAIFSVQDDGDLTITGDGKIDTLDNDIYAVAVQDEESHLVIESGEFIGNIHSVYVRLGSAEIKGGRYSVVQKFSEEKPYEYVLNAYDANYKAGTANIVVTGGTFEKFNPSDNVAEGEDTNFVAPGYTTTHNEADDTYTVISEATEI